MEKETIEYKGYTIKIEYDEFASNPREDFDHLGTMVCSHQRYKLGDKKINDPKEFLIELAQEVDSTIRDRIDYWENGSGWTMLVNKYGNGSTKDYEKCDEIVESIIQKSIKKNYIILSLYLYEHSGITMRTTPFSDPWDSGQVGYIYASIEKIKKEYDWKLLSKKRRQKIIDLLEAEVKEYDAYLCEEIYCYDISNDEEDHIHSCCGFYGDSYDYMIEDAKGQIDYYVEKKEEKEKELNRFMNTCWAD